VIGWGRQNETGKVGRIEMEDQDKIRGNKE
jgi:hypothetical protein